MAHQNKPVSIVIQDTNGKSLPGKLFRQIRVGFWRIFYPELYSISLSFCGDYTGLHGSQKLPPMVGKKWPWPCHHLQCRFLRRRKFDVLLFFPAQREMGVLCSTQQKNYNFVTFVSSFYRMLYLNFLRVIDSQDLPRYHQKKGRRKERW